jgi:hypothetical protein
MLVPHTDIPDTESWTMGPAARLFEGTPDTNGILGYHLEGHRPQTVPLGFALANTPLGVISTPSLIAFFRLDEPELLAGMTFFTRDNKTSLVYEREGEASLFRINGERNSIANGDVVAALAGMPGRAMTDPIDDTIGLGFLMNASNRARYSEDLLNLIRHPQQLNRLEILFEARTGEFRDARLIVQDRETQKLLSEHHSTDFPFAFPSRPKRRMSQILREERTSGARVERDQATGHRRAGRRGAEYASDGIRGGATGATGATNVGDDISHGKSTWGADQRPGAAGSGGVEFSAPKPITPTRRLPLDKMVAAIQAEADSDRQWQMIDENLRELKPDRTFRLLGHFAGEIRDRVADWPASRMTEFFGEQPLGALQLLIDILHNDVVLALLDGHPAREALLEQWREHELERLLAMRVSRSGKLTDTLEARQWLNLGPEAGAKAIRKVWRTVLGSLNVDFGRREETALHQKKDEIAKRLSAARDLLLRSAR